jgi:hypothetical protein
MDEGVKPQKDGRLRHHLQVGDRAWDLFYTPVARTVEGIARQVVRLQSGNIRIYLGWTLGTLLMLLWLMV